jgi:opacity protein-like surface antigen
MKLFYTSGMLAVLLLSAAQAADTTLTITLTSPSSTSITCGSATSYTFPAPVPAGTVICGITVQPSGWQGAFSLTQSGPQDNAFAISGANLVVGSQALTTSGNYSVSLTASP